ncbi:MAG: hypothetical protein ACI92S_004494, partial [Planctomycetaceae bacterium]
MPTLQFTQREKNAENAEVPQRKGEVSISLRFFL